MSIAIRFEDVSKQYRLGEVGTGTLSQDLHRTWARLRGRPDPFAQVGMVNDRSKGIQIAADHDDADRPRVRQSREAFVWALKDVSFDVMQGEILGIVGRNGAGKSTLLKLLSRVTAPTHGKIKANGRIASLLEVGTGFHPELTGRENLYLNGAILGMQRRETTKHLDEIVDFSGCEKYIDTPVKRYSSGMIVRLGFAVAAHLQCETLVVDEVLAVGDIEFQKKCLSKMKSVAGSGRTVLFVSHNMAAVRSLCQRAVTLRHGQITDDGTTVDVVGRYLSEFTTIANVQLSQRHDRSGDGSVRVTSLKIQSDLDTEFIASDSPLRICVTYDANAPIRNPRILVGIYDENDTGIYGLDSQVAGTIPSTLSASGTLCCVTEPIAITSGRCFVNVAFFNNETLADHVVNASYFDIESSDFFGNGRSIERSWMNTLLRHRWNCDEGHRDG